MLNGVIFLYISLSFAGPGEILNTSRQLFMEEGRKKSLTFLEKALRNSKAEDRQALLAEGEKLATRFKSDEGQREFELGESIYFSNKPGSMTRYNLAAKLEPDNTQIKYAKLRFHLRAGACSLAENQLKRLKEVWRHASLMPYFSIRVKECRGESLNLEKVKGLPLKADMSPYLKKLTIQALVEKGRGSEALGFSKELSSKEAAFSEIYYWLFRAGELELGGSLGYLRKYLKLCQSYGAVERRSFGLEPQLCGKTEEARRLVRARESGGV